MTDLPMLTGRWTDLHNYVKTMPQGEVPEFIPVRTSLGIPRFMPKAGGYPYANELAPYGIKHIEDREEFQERYYARLDKHGLLAITQKLGGIHIRYGKPLLLLCYEDLSKSWCHRRMFAEWWHLKTGAFVPEAKGLDRLSILEALS